MVSRIAGESDRARPGPAGRSRTSRASHGVVGDDQRLGGACEQVDADPPEELALGFGHVGVAGTDDHVDRLDRLGAERHRADRLHAAEHVDLVGAAKRIAATIAGCGLPWYGGAQAMMRFTPATRAVTMLMCAEATIGYLPPGT